MKSEGLSPGVQHGQRANACAEAFWIAGNDQQRLAYCREEDVIDLARTGQDKGIERVGNGEDHVEVRYREKLALALFEPLLASLGLTARAVPVPARVPDDVAKAATGALVEMTAEGWSAAERDGAQGTALWARQSMTLFVPRTNPADNLAERDAGQHDDRPSEVARQVVERADHFGDGLVRDVRIDLGRQHARMTEKHLHDTDVRPSFEQVCGEGMTKASRRDALAELRGGRGSLAALLNGGQADRTIGMDRTGKEQRLRMLAFPVAAQQVEQNRGERDVAILSTFTTPHMNDHARAVNVARFESNGLRKTKPAAVCDRQQHPIAGYWYGLEKAENFVGRRHDRQGPLSSHEGKSRNQLLPFEDLSIEELQRAHGHVEPAPGHFADITQMNLPQTDLIGGHLIG